MGAQIRRRRLGNAHERKDDVAGRLFAYNRAVGVRAPRQRVLVNELLFVRRQVANRYRISSLGRYPPGKVGSKREFRA